MEGRWLILSESYHGRSDIWTSLTPPAAGVPPEQYVKALPEDYTEELLSSACAVIIESIKLEATEKRKKWLKKLRADCTKAKVILIFDEIVTGFRVPKYCVSQWYDVEPDLITFGKAMGNGFPISVCGGKSELMDNPDYFLSATFSGDAMGLAACKATLTELKKKNMDDLIFYGQRFCDSFNKICEPIGSNIQGYGSRGQTDFYENPNTVLLFQEMCKAGVLFGRAFFWNFAHMESEIETQVLSLLQDAVNRIKQGKVKLEGKAPTQSFKR